jgi:hypothetical protein
MELGDDASAWCPGRLQPQGCPGHGGLHPSGGPAPSFLACSLPAEAGPVSVFVSVYLAQPISAQSLADALTLRTVNGCNHRLVSRR